MGNTTPVYALSTILQMAAALKWPFMGISLYNLHIFVLLQQGCVENTVFYVGA